MSHASIRLPLALSLILPLVLKLRVPLHRLQCSSGSGGFWTSIVHFTRKTSDMPVRASRWGSSKATARSGAVWQGSGNERRSDGGRVNPARFSHAKPVSDRHHEELQTNRCGGASARPRLSGGLTRPATTKAKQERPLEKVRHTQISPGAESPEVLFCAPVIRLRRTTDLNGFPLFLRGSGPCGERAPTRKAVISMAASASAGRH
jgi:hypothetical protein